MPRVEDIQQRGCRPRSRVLLFFIVCTAIVLIVVAVYTLIDRPTVNKLTPAGVNYNPGQAQDPSQPQ